MKNTISNCGYFFRETMMMIRQTWLSNLLSLFSICLILFILAMVFSGWRAGNHVVDVIQGEAEINVFYHEGLSTQEVSQLMGKLQGLTGVRGVSLVDKSEAYNRMFEILGDEAKVLKIFDENPFSPMIEVKIHLDKIDQVLKEMDYLTGIDQVQDNKAVLERLRNLTEILRLFGVLVLAAVGTSTLIIVSQIIRLGIQNNSEQINTLRLLGAPEIFIASPFVLQGLLLTISGGVLASAMAVFVLRQGYAQIGGQLSFVPLIPAQALISEMAAAVFLLSIILGLMGSLIGLTAAKGK